jgi:hypothetical protein
MSPRGDPDVEDDRARSAVTSKRGTLSRVYDFAEPRAEQLLPGIASGAGATALEDETGSRLARHRVYRVVGSARMIGPCR